MKQFEIRRSRTEQSSLKQSRTEQSSIRQSGTEQSSIKQNGTEQNRIKQNGIKQNKRREQTGKFSNINIHKKSHEEVRKKTGKYIKNIGTALLAAALLLTAGTPTVQAETKTAQETAENGTNLQLYARSAVLMDADSGRILYGKNENEQLPMASTTKIMTCILALENGSMEDVVTVSAYAAAQPKVHLGMYQEQKFRLGDLLYSLMLESHNDAAVAIAEHVGGSVEGFAGLMNQKAQELGCKDTFFITPNGLDASLGSEGGGKVHSTTAADLARIMKYCIGESPKSGEFLEVTRAQSYSFTDVEGRRSYSCNNHNAFLTMMEGALSGKTGFTNNAGYCYVGALRRDGKTFVVALLACGWPNNRNYKWSDTRRLMSYGLENYEYHNVYEEVELRPVLVEGGIPDSQKPYDEAFVAVEIAENDGKDGKELNILLKEGEKVEKSILLPEKLTAPVESGKRIGAVNYYLEGELLREYPVLTSGEIEELNFAWMVRYIWKQYSL